ncbi:MAG TPA: M20/M25/M40 family metallo-hydrolase [candidate division Zixibacteria bacterium]|nr:M20/M25/M40 family metallo-hydrolase [candidate division Zixibacteria bacterium]
MDSRTIHEKLAGAIEADRGELVDLCLKLGNLPSPHGKERRLGEAVLAWLAQRGIDGELQLITAESANAVATLPGAGSGRSLIFNAHMDTGPELGPDATEAEKKMETAWVEGDMLFGKGMINDKAQLCAFMIAMAAIKKSGIRLKGDLTLTAVAFETGEPSVDQQQGIGFPGEGFGTKWLVDRGVVADYALVGETSGFGIVQAECGAAWFKIRVKGREVYTPRLERGASIRENPNAFAKAAHVLLALEQWFVEYEKRETMSFAGGTIVPKGQVVAVRGSQRGIGAASPFCDIFADVRIAPGKNPLGVKRELEALLRRLDLGADVKMFQYSRGHIARSAGPLIAAVAGAHRRVFGAEPPEPPAAETSMWRDLNVFNEIGIPAICYGPPRQREPMSGAQNRAMRIEDLLQATKVYALAALEVCGVEGL